MLPLAFMVPLALVSLDLLVPWPSALDVGLLPVPVPSGWASEAVRSSRRLSADNETEESDEERREREHEEEPEDEAQKAYGKALGRDYFVVFQLPPIVLGLTIAWLGQLVFACLYKTKVADKRPPLQDGAASCASTGDFATGAFSCCDDTPTLMHAWCCLCCRAGDTYQAAGIEQYWTVILMFVLATVIGVAVEFLVNVVIMGLFFGGFSPTFGYFPDVEGSDQWLRIGWLVSCLIQGGICQRYRRKLRTKLGGSEEGGPNIVMDVLLFGFCTCCVVAQEARELDAATGVKVECCCQLTGQPLDDQPLIGEPVHGNVA